MLFGPSGIWDLIYEHVSYFTVNSLSYLAESEGFRVIDSGVTYGEQYLWLVGESDNTPAPQPDRVPAAEMPKAHLRETLENWQKAVGAWSSAGSRVALWGAGAKGITFANLLDPSNELFSIYDINPKKWNRYIPCSGHRIEAPERLSSFRPDVVVAMNPLYVNEIKETVHRVCPDAHVVRFDQLSTEVIDESKGSWPDRPE
jgi:hypothetical protein